VITKEETSYYIAVSSQKEKDQIYSVDVSTGKKHRGLPMPWGMVNAVHRDGKLRIGKCTIPASPFSSAMLYAMLSKMAVFSKDEVVIPSHTSSSVLCTPSGGREIEVKSRMLPSSVLDYSVSSGVPLEVIFPKRNEFPWIVIFFRIPDLNDNTMNMVNQITQSSILYTSAKYIDEERAEVSIRMVGLDGQIVSSDAEVEELLHGRTVERLIVTEDEGRFVVEKHGETLSDDAKAIIPVLKRDRAEVIIV